MKFLLIAALAICGLTINHVVCDTSSGSSTSEEGDSVELGEIDFLKVLLSKGSRYTTPPPQYHPPMYPPIYPPIHPIANPKCQLCIMVVTYISQHGGTSMQSRKTSLKFACSHVGAVNSYECKSFIQTYGQQLTRVVRPLSDPNSICRSIHVC